MFTTTEKPGAEACHACGKGHWKSDPTCEKYAATVAGKWEGWQKGGKCGTGKGGQGGKGGKGKSGKGGKGHAENKHPGGNDGACWNYQKGQCNWGK